MTDVERNIELKDLIIYVERLPEKDTYRPVTINSDYGEFFKPIANQDNLPKSPDAIYFGELGQAPLLIGADYIILGIATALSFASVI